MKKKVMMILIPAVLIFVVLVAALFIKRAKENKNPHEFIVSDVLITTDITQPEAAVVIDFVKKALKDNFIPKEIALPEVILKQSQGNSIEYRASWNKDGKFISLLYVRQKDTKNPYYLRLWVLPELQAIDEKKSQSLLADLFKEDFITSAGEIKCHTVKLPDGSILSECGNLKTQEKGELRGITVRTPVMIEDTSEKATVVSVCLIPKEASSTYPSALCD